MVFQQNPMSRLQQAPSANMNDLLNATKQSQNSLTSLFDNVANYGKADKLDKLLASGKLDNLDEYETRKLIASSGINNYDGTSSERTKGVISLMGERDKRTQINANREDNQLHSLGLEGTKFKNKAIMETFEASNAQNLVITRGKQDRLTAKRKADVKETGYENAKGVLFNKRTGKWVNPPLNADGTPMVGTKGSGKNLVKTIGGFEYNEDAITAFFNLDQHQRANLERRIRNGEPISWKVTPAKRNSSGQVLREASGEFFNKARGESVSISSSPNARTEWNDWSQG